jgi:hypothetical protein
MTRRLALAAGCAIFGALAGAAAMVLFYGFAPNLTVEMTHDRPGVLQGFYEGEHAGGLTFAWTAERGDLPLAGLDRNVRWIARVRLRGGRQQISTLPMVTILADGTPIASHQTSNEFEDIDALIPLRPGPGRGLILSIASSNTFVPGPGDPRHLGVQVDRISLEPTSRGVFPPRRAVAIAGVASAVFGAIFGLLGATATTAVAAATLLAVAQAAVLRVGLGPFSQWLSLIDPLACGIGMALLVFAFVIERWRHERLRNTARFALMFTGSALYLRLLVLLHPDKVLIDALFHAHRLDMVMAGRYFFPSIAPGGYPLPYPIALYIVALPVANLVTDHVLLLRLVAGVAEAVSFLFFYWMVVRGSGDRQQAAVAVAILQLMPLSFGMFAGAALTSVFGQAMAVVTMSLATTAVAGTAAPWLFIATGVVALVAFLSHTITFATLSVVLASSGLLLVVAGAGSDRRAGLKLIVTLGIAMALAVGLYYGHFIPTYRSELARIRGGVSGAGGASILSSAAAVLPTAASYYGWPFLLLAGVGLVVNLRAHRRDPWWLLIWGWLLAAFALLVLSVLTPLDFRHYYAAMPAIAVLAASAVVVLWRIGGPYRGLAVVVSGLGALLGVNNWLGVIAAPLF